MDELFIKGNKYISSKRASELTGYAKDYIGQLARGEKILATRVGRSWYVDELALLTYGDFDKDEDIGFSRPITPEGMAEKVATPETKVVQVPKVFSTVSHAFLNTSKNLPHTWSAISYSADDFELLPTSKLVMKASNDAVYTKNISDSQEKYTNISSKVALRVVPKHVVSKQNVFFDLPPSFIPQKTEHNLAKNQKIVRVTRMSLPRISEYALYALGGTGASLVAIGIFWASLFISSNSSLSMDTHLYTASVSLSGIHVQEILEQTPFIRSGIEGLNNFYQLITGSAGDLFSKGLNFIKYLINLV